MRRISYLIPALVVILVLALSSVFIVDERNEPITSDRNNFNNINNVFFKHIETNYYSYSNDTDLDFAAKKYEDTIFKKLPLKLESQFSNAYVILNCEQIQRYI